MPHIVIEYSADAGLAGMDLVQAAHKAAIGSGLFSAGDVKTRAYGADDYLVGEEGRKFIHARVYLLEGRTMEQKQQLSVTLMQALKPCVKRGQHLSVDIRELVRDTYRKQLID